MNIKIFETMKSKKEKILLGDRKRETHKGINRRNFIQKSTLASGSLLLPLGLNAGDMASPRNLEQSNWKSEDIPSQKGKVFVITGGNGSPIGEYSGLGYEDALALAAKEATVVIASRSESRAESTLQIIKGRYPDAKIEFERLDLSDLDSVASFSERIKSKYEKIDVLINNAGFAGYVNRKVTPTGLEKCFATNVVGHFALTAHLLPLLKKAKAPRVVFLSSTAANGANFHLDDLQTEKDYTFLKAYSASKFAVQMLAYEMHRRSEANNWGITCMPVHPGVALTFLIPTGPGPDSAWGKIIKNDAQRFKPAAQGCLSTLYAATSNQVEGGKYYGPDESGTPVEVKPTPGTQNQQDLQELWNNVSGFAGIEMV